MSEQKKKDLKEKIIKFVNQTHTSGPNPISFNEFSFNNPDRHQKMGKQEALATAVKLIKDNKMRLIEDNDTVEPFNQIRYLELAEKEDHKQFNEEYSRFLARCDIMGAAYNAEQQSDFLGPIQYDLIDKISEFVIDMNYEVRQEFANTLNTYLVIIFLFPFVNFLPEIRSGENQGLDYIQQGCNGHHAGGRGGRRSSS